jgi:hypothetical protein
MAVDLEFRFMVKSPSQNVPKISECPENESGKFLSDFLSDLLEDNGPCLSGPAEFRLTYLEDSNTRISG